MASILLKLTMQTFKTPNPPSLFLYSKTQLQSLPIPLPHHHHHHHHHHHSLFSLFPQKHLQGPRIPSFSLKQQPSSSSSSNSSNPPTTKEEAILQAKTCLTLSLEKPLNNPRLAGKLKKLKQPRFRVEIPVVDDSPGSLTQLAFQIFSNLPIKRKDSPPKILILWSNPTLSELASESSPNSVENSDLASSAWTSSSADVAVFLAPESSQLDVIRAISDRFYPKPVVVFNPKWGYEEESGLGELGGFVGSFEVVYSFMGLEVRGILSRRKGVVFKCVTSNEGWVVLVEEEKGKLKVVSRFKKRPSVGEVENVLYNLMAVNSPVTKSVKFIRDVVSNVTGKKEI